MTHKKKYVYVVIHPSKVIQYLAEKKDRSGQAHPYSKDPWIPTNSLILAYKGTRSRPPRKKFGDSHVISVEVDKIHEYIKIHRLMTS